jgi:hypothetical protein
VTIILFAIGLGLNFVFHLRVSFYKFKLISVFKTTRIIRRNGYKRAGIREPLERAKEVIFLLNLSFICYRYLIIVQL